MWERRCAECEKYNHFASKCPKKVNHLQDYDEYSTEEYENKDSEIESMLIEEVNTVDKKKREQTTRMYSAKWWWKMNR